MGFFEDLAGGEGFGASLAKNAIAISGGFLAMGAQERATGEAGRVERAGADEASAALERGREQALEFGAPFRTAGEAALPGLAERAFSDEFAPGFYRGRRLGTEAITGSAAARGELRSGETGRSISDLMSQLFAREKARRVGNLSDLAERGARAAGEAGSSVLGAGQDIAGINVRTAADIGEATRFAGAEKALRTGVASRALQRGIGDFITERELGGNI